MISFDLFLVIVAVGCVIDIILNIATVKRIDELERKLGVYSGASKTLTRIVHDIYKQQQNERFLTVEQRRMINKTKGDENVRQN